MPVSEARLSLADCEAIFYAALKAGDGVGAVAALKIMVTLDPHCAQALFDATQLALDIARNRDQEAPRGGQ